MPQLPERSKSTGRRSRSKNAKKDKSSRRDKSARRSKSKSQHQKDRKEDKDHNDRKADKEHKDRSDRKDRKEHKEHTARSRSKDSQHKHKSATKRSPSVSPAHSVAAGRNSSGSGYKSPPPSHHRDTPARSMGSRTPARSSPPALIDMTHVIDINAGRPTKWVSDETFLDKTEIKGLPLYRNIQHTQFSTKNAGKDIRTLRMVDLCYWGLDQWHLRLIAAGRFVALDFLFSAVEVHCMHAFLKELRGDASDKGKVNLTLPAQAWAAAQSPPMPYTTPDQKKAAVQAMATANATALLQISPTAAAAEQHNATKDLMLQVATPSKTRWK